MYLEVYPDLIFILNFFMDLILIILLKKINRKKSNKGRLLASAAFGGFVAVLLSIFIWMNVLIRFLLMYIFASIIMLVIAFGKMKIVELIKQVVLLNLITFFVGGLVNAVYYHTNFRLILISLGKGISLSNISFKFLIIIFLLLLPLLLILLWFKRFYNKNQPLTYKVELIFDGKSVITRGLMDTGNLLYDPIFKKPIILMDKDLMKQLLSLDFCKDIDKAKEYIKGSNQDKNMWDIDKELILKLRLIPYHSVGKSGMLIGIKLDNVLVYTEKETICNEKVIAAISDNSLSTKDKYQVILHKELLNV